MKWIIFACFVVISFTALAADADKPKVVKKKRLNFRTLASVSNDVQKEVETRYRDNMLREEEQRILKDEEAWLKTLEFMEKNSHE